MNMRNIRKIIIFAYTIVFCCFHLVNNASYLKINQLIGINNHYDSYNCDEKSDFDSDTHWFKSSKPCHFELYLSNTENCAIYNAFNLNISD